jgi:hypothetical protein
VFLGLVTPECQAIPTAAEQQMHDEQFDEILLSDSVRDYEMAEVAEYLKKPYALIITHDTMYIVMCCLKAEILESEYTAIASQQLH